MENNSFENTQEQTVDFKSLFINYLNYWYFYLIVIIVGVFVAYFYNTFTPPLYRVQSIISISDGSNKSQAGNEMLDELDVFGTKKNIENELEILKSRSLMDSVLHQLDFEVSYFWIGNFTKTELYNKSPFLVHIDTVLDYSGYFDLKILDNNTFFIKLTDNNKIDFQGNYSFGQQIKTPAGLITIVRQLNYFSFDFNKVDLQEKRRSFRFNFNQHKTLMQKYMTALKVEMVGKKSSAFKLSVIENVPQKGVDFLNKLVELYRKEGVKQKNEIATNTLNFITERLEYISSDLSTIESEIENYKVSRGITDLGSEAKIFLESVKDYDVELSKIKMQLGIIEHLQVELNRKDGSSDRLMSIAGINDPVLNQLIMQLSDLEIQKEKSKNLKSSNPINIAANIDGQIKKLKFAILEHLIKYKESLLISKKSIENSLARFESNIKSIPKLSRELLGIERQQEIKEKLYLYLLQKQEETAVSQAATVSDCIVIDKAFASDTPVKPVKTLSYLIALAVGVLLPTLIIYLFDFIRDTVKEKAEIIKKTGLSVLSSISESDFVDEGVGNIVVGQAVRTAVSEQFRSLRANLSFFATNQDCKSILITSSMSGEGKTFIGINLALTLALSGKKVIVLELDLRKPKLSHGFGIQNTFGISNYLIGKAELNSIIIKSTINDNLSIVSSGPIPPNPSELILSERMKDFMNYLKEEFDYIIIDSPPVGLVADAMILNKFSDLTLYVVRQNKTKRQDLDNIRELHVQNRLNSLSIIFNGVNKSALRYGYRNGYYLQDNNYKKHSWLKRIFGRDVFYSGNS